MYQPRLSSNLKERTLWGNTLTLLKRGFWFTLSKMFAGAQRIIPTTQKADLRLTRAITVNRPVEDVYRFWHDLTNVSQIIDFVEDVYFIGNTLTHWTLNLPGGLKPSFDVETYMDIPNQMISWRSLPQSPLQHAGSVTFRPNASGQGVQVLLTLEFVPPEGALGDALRKAVGANPAANIDKYLQKLKQMMENERT